MTPNVMDSTSYFVVECVVSVGGIPLKLGVHVKYPIRQSLDRTLVRNRADKPPTVGCDDLEAKFFPSRDAGRMVGEALLVHKNQLLEPK